MDYNSKRNTGCRITEFFHRGLRMLCLQNEVLRVTMVLDKGADIIEITDKKSDINLMWQTPVGIREYEKYFPSIANTEGNFHDYYPGGWQLVLPGGGPMNYYGADIGLHGELCLVPWEFTVLCDTAEKIEVRLNGEAYRTPYSVSRVISLASGKKIISFHESVTNHGGDDMQLMWGNHPAVGEPFLDEHCVIDVPAGKLDIRGDVYHAEDSSFGDEEANWPYATDAGGTQVDFSKMPAKTANCMKVLFLKELHDGWFAVTNTKKNLGYGMVFDTKVFPCLWYWQVAKGHLGYPWYSATYQFALEPWSGYPSSYGAAQKNGSLALIRAGETIETDYKFVLYESTKGITKIEKDGVVKTK